MTNLVQFLRINQALSSNWWLRYPLCQYSWWITWFNLLLRWAWFQFVEASYLSLSDYSHTRFVAILILSRVHQFYVANCYHETFLTVFQQFLAIKFKEMDFALLFQPKQLELKHLPSLEIQILLMGLPLSNLELSLLKLVKINWANMCVHL